MISYKTLEGSTYYYSEFCWKEVEKLFELYEPESIPEYRLMQLAYVVIKDNKLVKSRYSIEYLCDLALLDL